MKTILVFALLLCFNFCNSQSIKEETQIQNEDSTALFSLTDSIMIKVDHTEDFSGYGTGGGFIKAKKGYKFIGVYVYFSNHTKYPVDLDLTEVYLLDIINKEKYKVYSVMGTGPFTAYKKRESSLKPGKEIYRKLVFGVPDILKAQLLLYRNSLVKIDNVQK